MDVTGPFAVRTPAEIVIIVAKGQRDAAVVREGGGLQTRVQRSGNAEARRKRGGEWKEEDRTLRTAKVSGKEAGRRAAFFPSSTLARGMPTKQ